MSDTPMDYIAAAASLRACTDPQKRHAADVIDELFSYAEKLRAFAEDVAEHGLRHDLNPTHDLNDPEPFWHRYIRGADAMMRERAAEALGTDLQSQCKSEGCPTCGDTGVIPTGDPEFVMQACPEAHSHGICQEPPRG